MTSALSSATSATTVDSSPAASTAPKALTSDIFSIPSDYVTTVSYRVDGLKEIYLPKSSTDLRVTFVFESEEATDRSFKNVSLAFGAACAGMQHYPSKQNNLTILDDLLKGPSLVPAETFSPCTLSYKTKGGFGTGGNKITTQNELVSRILREFEFASPPSASREIKVRRVEEVTSIRLCN